MSSFQKPGIGFYDGLLVSRYSFNVGGKDIFLALDVAHVQERILQF